MAEKLAYSVPEMAKMLGISRNGAYNLVKSAGFPAIALGRRVLIPVDALQSWLNRKAGGARDDA